MYFFVLLFLPLVLKTLPIILKMITYEEDQLPVTQVLVTVDDVSREGGG